MTLVQKFTPSCFIGSLQSNLITPFEVFFTYSILALITPLAMYFGSTSSGWSFSGSVNYLDTSTAFQICILSFFNILILTSIIAFFTRWMSKTFGSLCSYFQAFSLIAYSSAPLLVSGVAAIYPSISIGIAAFLLGLAGSIFLLFKMTPKIMQTSDEQGFLFAATICTVSMVMFVSLVGASVVLWDSVFILTTH